MRRRVFLVHLVSAAAGLVALAACRHSDLPGAPANAFGHRLYLPVVQRLQLAREVAWAKFHSSAPVHDPPRDLAADLRPALDALTPAIIAALPAGPRPDLTATIERGLRLEGFTPEVATLASAPLR